MVKFFNISLKLPSVFTRSSSYNMVGSQVGPVHHVSTPFETATFGMGCFWSADSLYGATYGVLRTRVGYSGGSKPTVPKYKDIGDHVECITLDYDPNKVSYNKLLNLFWNNHEYGLTTRVKRQYMSMIFCHSEEQKQIAMQSIEEERVNRAPQKIITEIVSAGPFYPAEDYHQKFRLQAHKDLAKQLGLNSDLLQTSFVAAKLNGFLVGVGGLKQFDEEAHEFGLTQPQLDYVRRYIQMNDGAGLSC